MYGAHLIGAQLAAAGNAAPDILAPHKASKAGRYNAKRARRIGWSQHWSGVCRALGIVDGMITAETFSQYVAKFQTAQRLEPDGMLGTETWRRMATLARTGGGITKQPLWLPKARPGLSPIKGLPTEALEFGAPWMAVARREEQTNWINDKGNAIVEGDTRVDEGYFEACPYHGSKTVALHTKRKLENNAWCSAFVNYCLHTAGYSHTGSSGAFSFKQRRRWRFQAISEPRRGCVIVMRHNTRNWDHVAFLDEVGNLPSDPDGDINSRDYEKFTLLGGNQGGESVNSRTFPNWTFFAARDRYGNRSPYLFPERAGDEANCNVELPTAAPHYCGEQWQ